MKFLGEAEVLIISEEEAGERLDKILARRYQKLQSRSYFQFLIEQQLVLVNGAPVKKRTKLTAGDEVEICFVATPEIDVHPEPIPLDIIYEDDFLLAIRKPPGMVVHPAPGNWSGTFVNALLHHCRELPMSAEGLRPGIVHRLDKGTTGVLVAAKTMLAQQRLVAMFASRQAHKEYLAICVGNPGKGKIELPIGRHPTRRKLMTVEPEKGKMAISLYETLAFDEKLSIVKIVLKTGRTHQIRVHMKHLGSPVLGDEVYGVSSLNKKYGALRPLLHARLLQFSHPITGEELRLWAPIPEDMRAIIQKIEPKLAEELTKCVL